MRKLGKRLLRALMGVIETSTGLSVRFSRHRDDADGKVKSVGGFLIRSKTPSRLSKPTCPTRARFESFGQPTSSAHVKRNRGPFKRRIDLVRGECPANEERAISRNDHGRVQCPGEYTGHMFFLFSLTRFRKRDGRELAQHPSGIGPFDHTGLSGRQGDGVAGVPVPRVGNAAGNRDTSGTRGSHGGMRRR
jgi:hypothetical protein